MGRKRSLSSAGNTRGTFLERGSKVNWSNMIECPLPGLWSEEEEETLEQHESAQVTDSFPGELGFSLWQGQAEVCGI